MWSRGHFVPCLLYQIGGQQLSEPSPSDLSPRKDMVSSQFPFLLLRPPGCHPVPSPSENPKKKKLASFGTLNPGGNFRTEVTLRTRQKSLRSQSDFPSMPPLGVQSSASAASPGCHLLAKERNEQGPVGVDCGHRAVSCSSKRTQGAPRTAVG